MAKINLRTELDFLRFDCRMKIPEIAAAANVSHVTVYRWLKDREVEKKYEKVLKNIVEEQRSRKAHIMPTYTEFRKLHPYGNALAYLHRCGVSDHALCLALNLNLSTVQSLRYGRQAMTLDYAAKVIEAFDMFAANNRLTLLAQEKKEAAPLDKTNLVVDTPAPF